MARPVQLSNLAHFQVPAVWRCIHCACPSRQRCQGTPKGVLHLKRDLAQLGDLTLALAETDAVTTMFMHSPPAGVVACGKLLSFISTAQHATHCPCFARPQPECSSERCRAVQVQCIFDDISANLQVWQQGADSQAYVIVRRRTAVAVLVLHMLPQRRPAKRADASFFASLQAPASLRTVNTTDDASASCRAQPTLRQLFASSQTSKRAAVAQPASDSAGYGMAADISNPADVPGTSDAENLDPQREGKQLREHAGIQQPSDNARVLRAAMRQHNRAADCALGNKQRSVRKCKRGRASMAGQASFARQSTARTNLHRVAVTALCTEPVHMPAGIGRLPGTACAAMGSDTGNRPRLKHPAQSDSDPACQPAPGHAMQAGHASAPGAACTPSAPSEMASGASPSSASHPSAVDVTAPAQQQAPACHAVAPQGSAVRQSGVLIEVTGLWVAELHRRKGAARALMDHARRHSIHKRHLAVSDVAWAPWLVDAAHFAAAYCGCGNVLSLSCG